MLLSEMRQDAGERDMTTERKPAFDYYKSHVCVICGYSEKAVLQVAHLLSKKKSRKIKDLAIMCQNHHREFDLGLIPKSVVIRMRNFRETNPQPDHGFLIGLTKRQLRANAKKAARTRKKNKRTRK